MERDNQIREFNHVFNLVERKNVSISGVKKVESFDSEEFLIESVMGTIILKGEGLELLKLDTMQGVVTIKGLVNSLTYLDENILKKNKENSVISRLFK
ncbi:MAG: sporulation protein YabP [Bacilli bacterium]